MWDGLESVLQDLTSLTPTFAVVNPVWLPEVFPHLISPPVLKESTQTNDLYLQNFI